MIRTQRFCYHIFGSEKGNDWVTYREQSRFGKILLMFLYCFIVKRIFVCTCFTDVSWGVYDGVCFCQWERFLLFRAEKLASYYHHLYKLLFQGLLPGNLSKTRQLRSQGKVIIVVALLCQFTQTFGSFFLFLTFLSSFRISPFRLSSISYSSSLNLSLQPR